MMKELSFRKISLLLLAGLVFFGFTIMQPPRAHALDVLEEDFNPECPLGTYSPGTHIGMRLHDGNFEAYSNGLPATFQILPLGYGALRALIVIPDSQTDVGAGAGNKRAIRISYVDSGWFFDGDYYSSGPTINVNVFDDADDIDEHHSTIHFAAVCNTPDGERVIDLCSVVDIRIHYEGEDPSNVARGFRNSCESSSSGSGTPTQSAKSPSQQISSSQKPAASTTIADIPGVDAYLNEIEEYTKGEGTLLWLKPTEGAKFKLGADAKEEHSIRIKSLGDKSATIVVASDPIEFTLSYGESRKVNVDREGDDDIEITLLEIADGQAGIKVKPLTKAAAVATIHVPQSTAKKTTPIAAISASVVALLLAGAFFAYRKGLLSKLPIPLIRTTSKTKPKAKKR